jgi:FMN phosphatase YigB (HAD superfamily)
MQYKVICWDADGVTLRSSRLFSEQLATDYGLEGEKMRPFFKGVFKQCSFGKADLKEELAKVNGEWGWKGTVEELLEYWFTKCTELDQEVLAYVRTVRDNNVRCFMTTDQEHYRGEYLQKLVGNHNPFERVFYAAQIGAGKKEPAFWDHVYTRMNEASAGMSTLISKDSILVIDDDEKDIEMAKSLGFPTHLYRNLPTLQAFLSE